MYHAMIPSYMLMHLIERQEQNNFVDGNRFCRNHIRPTENYLDASLICPINYLRLMGREMAPIRNRGFGHYPHQPYQAPHAYYPPQQMGRGGVWRNRGNTLGPEFMPPPSNYVYHRAAHNNSVAKRIFWKKPFNRPARHSNSTDSSDSGFSSRSLTPINCTQGDQQAQEENVKDSDNQPISSKEGTRLVHNVYGYLPFCRHQQNNPIRSQQPFYHDVHGAFHQQLLLYNEPQFNLDGSQTPSFPRPSNLAPPIVDECLVNVVPPDRYLARSHLIQVTSNPTELLADEKWDKLSEEIWNKFMTNQQTEETYKKKMVLWKYLYHFIQFTFPRYELYIVGSTMSGFGGNNSDVDMCLMVRQSPVDQRNEAVYHLRQMHGYLNNCHFIGNSDVIYAKVPILRFHDSEQNLEVDLNCNNVVGIRNTHLLYCYSQMDWRVRPLVLLIKLWARKHNINDAKCMTISSYSLVLMVIHFLQCGVTPHVLPCLHKMYKNKFTKYSNIQTIDIHEDLKPSFTSDNKQTLGELLFEFFHYYVQFDFSMFAISVRLAAKIPIDDCRRVSTSKNDHQWKFLCIEEPFDLTNTARSVFDRKVFERIKAVFDATYNSLKKVLDLESIFELQVKD